MDEDEEMVYLPLDSDNVCKVCYAEFLDEEDLKVHNYTVHASFGVHCQFCTCISPSLEDYAGHIVDVHILSMKLCRFCNRAFVRHEDLEKHESKHVIKKDYKINKCSNCAVKFMSKLDLQNHEYVSHKDSDEGVFLNDVFPFLSSRLCFNAINFLQSTGKVYRYKCPVCQLKTLDVEHYLKHLKESNCKPLVCNSCSNVYKAKVYLKLHLKFHQECNSLNAEVKLTCNKCWLEIDSANYKKHIKTCEVLKCKICKTVYTDVHRLTQHQSIMHPMSIQMHLCKFCHKEFVGKVALNKHVTRCHQDLHLYKYRCVWCDERYFKHPQNLFAHFYSKHYKLNAFDCKICNMQFRVRKKFTLHIKLQHDSKGFVEFNKDYTVFFTDTKSADPFQPTSFFPSLPEENANDNQDNVINIEQLDDPTDYTTDAQTETELSKVTKTKKPLKLRFKNNSNLQLTTNDNPTDTNVNEDEINCNKNIKSAKNTVAHSGHYSDSDDQPLLMVKKQIKKKRGKYRKKGSKKAFTCDICGKFCYTFNNYNLHMSMHSNDEIKKCIKCNKEFSSKAKLNKHMSVAHKTSKLTETLKNILLRKKLGIKKKETEVSVKDKFKSTIKKVKVSSVTPQAEIKEVKENLSVQKYIESFMPEEMGKKVDIKSCVSINLVDDPGARPPKIKMTKFTPKPVPTGPSKLSLPVKFKNDLNTVQTIVKVSIVQTAEPEEKYYENDVVADNDYTDYNEDYETNELNEPIPEVAQEVMLESQESKPPIPQSIVIPKLPKDVDANDVKIAHLQPEAPFYKIVKMKDILKSNEAKTEQVPEIIKLPSGKKLVTVNPLAHLIGNAKIKELIGTRKDSSKNETHFKAAIAKALMNLDKPSSPKPKSKSKSKKKSVKNDEEAIDAVEIEQ